MTPFRLPLVALATGLLAAAPAFVAAPAFADPGSTAASTAAGDAQKQHTDGGDSPNNPRATDESAAAWHKQHTAADYAPDRAPVLQR